MIRIGVVGAGIIATEHLKHIYRNERAELAAVCDVALSCGGTGRPAVRGKGI